MIELRLLEDKDIEMLETWLNKEHVKKWYEIASLNITIDDWMNEIRSYKDEYKWITYLIALYDGKPIGMCLYYKCIDSDEVFDMPLDGTYGIDYLIGEEEYIGKGIGKLMLSALLNKLFSLPDCQIVMADIDDNNTASRGVLLSLGFIKENRYIKKKPI